MVSKYLVLLSEKYPNITTASNEIIKLEAIKSLPKGTEYFFSDLHGEYVSFLHLLKSASGMIYDKINKVFDKSLPESERKELAVLIYNPKKQINERQKNKTFTDDWIKVTIYRLIQVCNRFSIKYTRSRIRQQIPKDYIYIIEELLTVANDVNKDGYYEQMVQSIIETKSGEDIITALCELTRSLSIDTIHIIGDIMDRGPRPDIIMNELEKMSNIDIEWGNHDVSWIGAGAGNKALIANVIRIALSYNAFDLLEDGYGINLRALSVFATNVYRDDPCERFYPKMLDENRFDKVDADLTAKMHKALTIIQLKLESQLIERHPEYEMDYRDLLPKIDFKKGTINLDGKDYKLLDNNFPTIDPADPSKLTKDEEELMDVLTVSFRHSQNLQRHLKYYFKVGSMYKTINGNLLFHGCIPLDENGEYETVNVNGKALTGKELLDACGEMVVDSYFLKYNSDEQKNARDFDWYLWCGVKSPLYGKEKMAYFERYFLDNTSTYMEKLNPYFVFYEDDKNVDIYYKIFDDFGIDREKGHIINGHVPVKIKDGESPIKASGKLFVIDGGISKAYQSKTGIAGYTLIYNSHAILLAEHQPYKADDETQTPSVTVVEKMPKRVNICDTDEGNTLDMRIEDLTKLIRAYRRGDLREK